MRRRVRSESGFTLPELLISSAIMVIASSAIFTLLNPSSGIFRAQPEVSDLQQRMRVGVDTLQKDLLMAGGGAYSGSQSGSLIGFFAPVLPFRQGANPAIDDGPGVFRPDAITLMYVPVTSSQTTIDRSMPSTSAELDVAPVAPPDPNCPQGTNLCGFKEGMTVLIYDETGAFDAFTITNVQDAAMHIQHNQQGDLSKKYAQGSKLTQMASHVYYRDAATDQLKHYDGTTAGVGVPVIDNVVGLNFDYYGDPNPPQLRNPGSDQAVTYGPKPPALGVVQTNWPAGENCTFQLVGGTQQPRLAQLGTATGGLVKLTPSQLTDGPWCPDAVNVNRFDADLLRIRKVRVTLRIQVSDPSLRGLASTSPSSPFVRGGTASRGYAYVPDQIVQFDVSPRNLNLNR